jgi:hypothetical protein
MFPTSKLPIPCGRIYHPCKDVQEPLFKSLMSNILKLHMRFLDFLMCLLFFFSNDKFFSLFHFVFFLFFFNFYYCFARYTMWHLQKFLQHIIVEFIPAIIVLHFWTHISIHIHVYLVFPSYSPSYSIFLHLLPSYWYQSPPHRTCFASLFSVFLKINDILIFLR